MSAFKFPHFRAATQGLYGLDSFLPVAEIFWFSC